MSEIIFRDALPPPDAFRRSLAESITSSNPVDDLLELSRKLQDYEKKYSMPSAVFFQRYYAGTLDDELQHCIEWAAIYDLFAKTKRALEATLMRVAVQPELSGTAA